MKIPLKKSFVVSSVCILLSNFFLPFAQAEIPPPTIIYTVLFAGDGHYKGVSKWQASSKTSWYGPEKELIVGKNMEKVTLMPQVYKNSADVSYSHLWFAEPVVKNALGLPAASAKINYDKISNYLKTNDLQQLNWSNSTNRSVVLTPYYIDKWMTVVTLIRDSKAESAIGLNKNIDDYSIIQFRVADSADSVANGALFVSTSADTPSSQTVPFGATDKDLFHFQLKASYDEDISVKKLQIVVAGTTSPPIQMIKLYDGNQFIAQMSVVDSAVTIPGVFPAATFNNMNLLVKKGDGPKTIRVLGDFKNDLGLMNKETYQLIFTEESILASGNTSGAIITSKSGSVIGPTNNMNTTVQSNPFVY